MSKLIDIMNSPWAITTPMLKEIHGIYLTHLRGDKIDIAGVEARLGRELNNESKDYEVIDGVAVISAIGAIAKRMNLFTRISGGVSTEMLGDQIEHAVADKSVKAIVLDIDSPGGTVDGTFDLADKIHEMRGTKPIVAFTDGLMASAAYAIGAAADEIYISGATTTIGSIGVVATHVDVSKAEEKHGQKTTEITAGKYKRISSQYESLSEDGRADIQATVDYLYSIFVDRVATFRGVSTDTVINDMADGRLFIGQQAIDAGLVDGVSSIAALVESLSMGRTPDKKGVKMETSSGDVLENKTLNNQPDEVIEMSEKTDITKGYVEEHHPEIAEAFQKEGAETARIEGAQAECKRIQDVLAVSMAGHEDLVNKLAFDGVTTAPEAAIQVLKAEKANKNKVISDVESDAEVLNDVAASVGDDVQSVDDSNLPIEERCQSKWDASAGLRGEFNDNFKAYLAYEKKALKGHARILGKTGSKT